MSDEELLSEQVAFYRRRAPVYDEWWQRQGPYDHGEQDAVQWRDQVAEIAAALQDFGATGDVLELAGGTGWWTQALAAVAGRLTVVDASPEVLELNRDRVKGPDVHYVVADLFEWRPHGTYDVVFFSFWLSHVPRSHFSGFWQLVASCLGPEGRVFFIDNRHDPAFPRPDPYVFDRTDDIQRRRVSDGSEHRVVKVFYEPQELERNLVAVGWESTVSGTPWFIYGAARPAP